MLQQLLNSCAPSSGAGGVPAGATLDLPSMLWRAYLANHCSAFTKICCKKCFQIAAQCGEDGFLCSSGADVVCFHFVRQEAQRFGKRKKKSVFTFTLHSKCSQSETLGAGKFKSFHFAFGFIILLHEKPFEVV